MSLLLAALLAPLPTSAFGSQRLREPAPSALIIVLDDIGWPERPLLTALDSLAEQGMTFTRAYSWPVCSPTRAAAMYGVLPRRAPLGDVLNAHNPSASLPNVPLPHWRTSLFDALPTHEGTLIGKWHLGRAGEGTQELLSIACGFSTSGVVESGPFAAGAAHWLAGNPNSIAQGPGSSGYYDWYRVDDGIVQQSHATYATDAQRDAFLQWWTSTDAPRFGWLAFSGAHTPFDPPPGNVPTGSPRGDYLQVVSHLNGALATVLEAVDLSETFVFVFTDNGTPDDARPTGTLSGIWKGSTFEGGVNVPLLIAGPGIRTGASDRLVSLVDVPATLLELLDSRSRGFEDSRSFADELGTWTGSDRRSWVFTERFAVDASLSGSPQPEGYDDQAVIEAHWKLRRVDADGVGPEPARDRFYYLPGEFPLLPPIHIRSRLRTTLESVPPRP